MSWRKLAVVLLAILGFTMAYAGDERIEGVWVTPDAKTGQPTSEIKIKVNDGELTGKIVKLYPNAQGETQSVCANCTGSLKDKPLMGMTVLWGFIKNGATWTGGEVLAPKTGKMYGAELTPSSDGQTLTVKFKVGLFGSTQAWTRPVH